VRILGGALIVIVDLLIIARFCREGSLSERTRLAGLTKGVLSASDRDKSDESHIPNCD